MADATYGPKVYRKDGGDALIVASGGYADVESGGELRLAGTALTATAAEINRAADVSGRIVTVTAATLAVTEVDHDGKTLVLDRAAGITATLPAATGSGTRLRFLVKTALSGASHVIQVTGNDVMQGTAHLAQDGGDTSVMFETGADSDTITLNGSTTGGVPGAVVELEDIAADLWQVRVTSAATGSEATPFSAAV